jgi:FlaA1/EpsC-like NDP-sugar epimerase
MIDTDYSHLLNRNEYRFEESNINDALLTKRILVTGAGGSIGSALVRRIAKAYADKIWLVGHGEDSIFQLQQRLEEEECNASIIPVIADVYSTEVARIIEKENLDYVFHAAAHKHVGLMQANPRAAIANNTQATIWLARKCSEAITRFVFISTDKAVNPATVMGASKRLAEAWVSANSEDAVICRFGNVLGSSGSLVEIVERRAASGLPIHITHPDMRRYFITAKEAVGLVLTAGLFCKSGTYSLEMGEAILIENLVRKLSPDSKVFFDKQQLSAEKLAEEIHSADELVMDVDIHPGIRRIFQSVHQKLVRAVLEMVEDECNASPPGLGQFLVSMANKV